MKIYIQHAVSKRFVGLNSTWVPSLGGARDFHNSESALSFCFGRQLSTVALPNGTYNKTGRDMIWRVADAGTEAPPANAAIWEKIERMKLPSVKDLPASAA